MKFKKILSSFIVAVLALTIAVPVNADSYSEYMETYSQSDIAKETYTNYQLLEEMSEAVVYYYPDYWETEDIMQNFYDGINALIDSDEDFYELFLSEIKKLKEDFSDEKEKIKFSGNDGNLEIKLNAIENIVNADAAQFDKITKAMISVTDIFSAYRTAEEFFSGQADTSVGLGIQVNQARSFIQAAIVMPGSGAELAGIQKGDMIIAVDGVPFDLNNPDMPSTRGDANSTVNITVLRGSDEILEIPVTRVNFTGGTVRSERFDDTYVITFKAFEEMSDAEDFERFYDEAASDPTITKLVIDLRDNGGGFVNVLDAMLSVLTPKDMPLYSYESKYERIDIFSDGVYKGAGKKFDGTLFVLTNENTASCGDMMTAVIKNIGGIQVGTPTYGKGVVQSNPDMHNYHVLTITSHHTVVPNYGRTHGKPYIPDVDMPELVLAYEQGEVYELSDRITPITEDSPIVRIKAYQQLLASAYSMDLGIEITGVLDAKTMLITNEFRRQLGYETSDELIIDTKTLEQVYKEGKADIVEDQLINSKTDKGLEYVLNYNTKDRGQSDLAA